MPEDLHQIELRSDEVQEILGTPPSWIVRWGTTITLLTLCCILAAGWLIRVPETIMAPLVIKSTNEPIRIKADKTDRFMVLVGNGDTVKAGTYMALKGSEANPDHVLSLERTLDSLRLQPSLELTSYVPDRTLELGEIQPLYIRFIQEFDEYQFRMEEGEENYEIRKLRAEISRLDNLIVLDRRRLRNRLEKFAFYERMKEDLKDQLVERKISHEEYRRKRQEVVELENEIDDIKLSINQNEQSILNLQTQISALKQANVQKHKGSVLELKNTLEVLYQEVRNWKQKHLIRAPESGYVMLPVGYNARQFYPNTGRDILSLVPLEKKEVAYFAEVRLPKTGSGKVKPGQRAIIKLKGYPAEDFGFIEGRVLNKPAYADSDEHLALQLELPRGLQTSMDGTIPYEYAMEGNAEIIIEEKRFLERLFDNFFNLVKGYG